MSLEILPLQPEFAWLKQNFDGVGLDAMFFFEFEQRQPDLPTIFDFHERLKNFVIEMWERQPVLWEVPRMSFYALNSASDPRRFTTLSIRCKGPSRKAESRIQLFIAIIEEFLLTKDFPMKSVEFSWLRRFCKKRKNWQHYHFDRDNSDTKPLPNFPEPTSLVGLMFEEDEPPDES